jgi:hypothetical protein
MVDLSHPFFVGLPEGKGVTMYPTSLHQRLWSPWSDSGTHGTAIRHPCHATALLSARAPWWSAMEGDLTWENLGFSEETWGFMVDWGHLNSSRNKKTLLLRNVIENYQLTDIIVHIPNI